MADALNRRHSLQVQMRVNVPGFDSFMDFYAYLLSFSCRIARGQILSYMMVFFLCIPENSLRLKLIQELYNEGHVGRDGTRVLPSCFQFLLLAFYT